MDVNLIGPIGPGYTNGSGFLSNATYGSNPAVKGFFTAARVAAGGTRIFKTSASTTESGMIKGFFADRGGQVTKNLGQLLNYY